MVTVGEFFSIYRPGFTFGIIFGFILSLYLETFSGGSVFFVKLLEYNTYSKGLLIIGFFAILGFFIQWRMGWRVRW